VRRTGEVAGEHESHIDWEEDTEVEVEVEVMAEVLEVTEISLSWELGWINVSSSETGWAW
jgi:hypothetical protein